MDSGFVRVRTLFYLLYAVVLTAALLYLRFPTEKFRAYCEKKVESILVDSDCSIEGIGYRPPFSLLFTNFQLVREMDGQSSTFMLHRLAVTPVLPDFLHTFQLGGELYQGSMAMKVALDNQEKTFALSDIALSGVSLEEMAANVHLLDRQVSGKMHLSGNYRANLSAPFKGTGKGELRIEEGSVELLQPILSLRNLTFDRISTNLALEKEMVRFDGGTFNGKEIGAEFSGEMRLASPLPNSIVILGGQLTPRDNFLAAHPGEKRLVEQLLRRYRTNALPFKVGGTVRRPTFRFSL